MMMTPLFSGNSLAAKLAFSEIIQVRDISYKALSIAIKYTYGSSVF